MATPWYLGRLAAFDLETTAADPEQARIVEAYVGYVGGGLEPIDRDPLLVNPGIEVPAEAAAIHGYSTAHLQEHGVPAEQGVATVGEALAEAIRQGIPLVGHNIRFDLTIVERELARYQLPSLTELAGGKPLLAIDTLILSKHLDQWRRRVSETQGAHTLKTTAQVFGVAWSDEDAHGARYDALVSARVAWQMGRIAHMPFDDRPRNLLSGRDDRRSLFGDRLRNLLSGRDDRRSLFGDLSVDLPVLHAHQKRWAAEQAASFQQWLRSAKAGPKQDATAVISGDWPVQSPPTP